jgi:hypothetical protein
MAIQSSPLAPTAVTGVVTLGGVTTALAQAPLTGYSGKPLYFHVQSNGQTLSIVIDDNSADSAVLKPPAATAIDVTFMLNDAIVEHWPTVAAAYAAVNDLTFAASFDAALQTLTLSISDTPTSVVPGKRGAMEFVLAQTTAGTWLIKWLPMSREFDVITTGLTNIDLVPPPPPQGAGGVYGPMGIALS